jgi:hypothetical protein
MQALARHRSTALTALAALTAGLAVALGGATTAHGAGVSIAGTVTLPGDAPASFSEGVYVVAQQTDGSDSGSAFISAANGTYSIDGLAPGIYSISFNPGWHTGGSGGAVETPLKWEFYSDTQDWGAATFVDARFGNVTGIDAALEWATGSISGTVSVDSGSRSGLTVIASSAATEDVVASVDPTTGAYTLPHLLDHDYVVSFHVGLGPGGATLRNEVYNDVYDPADATLVPVTGGGAVTGIDALLSAVGHFTTMPTPTITWIALNAGSTLGSTVGTWSPSPDSTARQWYRNGVAISGATGSQYVITPTDRGKTITLKVTAKKAGFTSASKTSAGLKIPLVFTTTPTPTITGTNKSGSVLTASHGTWAPTPSGFTYQWRRDGLFIAGATGSKYTLTPSDRGHYVSVTVTATKSGYLETSRTSATVYVLKVFTSAPVPTITGTAKSGHTLTAKHGTWAPVPKGYAYQWYRNGAKISGATKSTFALTKADKGKKITVKVTATRGGYVTTSRLSAAVSVAK